MCDRFRLGVGMYCDVSQKAKGDNDRLGKSPEESKGVSRTGDANKGSSEDEVVTNDSVRKIVRDELELQEKETDVLHYFRPLWRWQ